ncbi:MAG: hypothetical protein HQK50_06165 [Oligoflexia bacterium]|nr:hypothetical protein [Oligoflexia bacterium]MBF0365136.1 hypothetical protein [Oligoflexia bacterium]
MLRSRLLIMVLSLCFFMRVSYAEGFLIPDSFPKSVFKISNPMGQIVHEIGDYANTMKNYANDIDQQATLTAIAAAEVKELIKVGALGMLGGCLVVAGKTICPVAAAAADPVTSEAKPATASDSCLSIAGNAMMIGGTLFLALSVADAIKFIIAEKQ